MANSSVILKALGLQTSNNELESGDGALIEADNVIIKRNNIIEQRRGFKLWGDELSLTNETVKQLTTYRNRIIRHYSDILEFDSSGNGDFSEFSGSFLEAQTGLRMKFIEANGNFYFTTADGVKKISAPNAEALSTEADYIIAAGAIKALDLTGEYKYTAESQSAFLPQDSAVAYRVTWGYNDANNNLVLGAPSQRLIVGNPMTELLIRDYMIFLGILDSLDNTVLTTARINDKTYIQTLGLDLSSDAFDLYTNLIALTTKIDNDIQIGDDAGTYPLNINAATVDINANVMTISFTAGDARNYLSVGSKVYLGGTWTAPGAVDASGARVVASVDTGAGAFITINLTAANGAVVVASPTIVSNEYRSITPPTEPVTPATNDQLVEMQDYISNIVTQLISEPAAIVNTTDNTTLSGFDVTTTSTVELTITVPENITSNYFYQIYRSPVSSATGASVFDDVSPSDELQLVYESYPTDAELSLRTIVVEDITPDTFRGVNLYTNASTGEGILQSNDVPPFCKDLNRYRNSVFYANTRTLHRSFINLLGVSQMISDYDLGNTPTVTIANSSVSNTYKFMTGIQEYTEITITGTGATRDGTYFTVCSPDNSYYVWISTGVAADPAPTGYTQIKVDVLNADTAAQMAGKIRNKLKTYISDFVIGGATTAVNILNYKAGYVEPVDIATSGAGLFQPPNSTGQGERVQPQIINLFVTTNGAGFPGAGVAPYVQLNTTNDDVLYYLWFQKGTTTDPAFAGRTGIEIPLTGTETTGDIQNLIVAALPSAYFTAVVNGGNVEVTNNRYGYAGAPADDGWVITSVLQEGALDVLLSSLVSPAQSVDETARSFVRVMNKNPEGNVYAYYLSSIYDIPGKILLESRSLEEDESFYVIANSSGTGTSFNPDISPEGTLTNTAANPTVITTSVPHGLLTGDTVIMTDSNSSPIIDGAHVITRLTASTFTINKAVSIGGTTGSFIKSTNAVFSENEEKINRVYYSKYLQPDAVPIANYFDVGAADKAILRIVPLRDSLFVFKEDGLYRISGETAPFQLELFDSSFITLAPDSVSVANNIIYAWTTQGIQSLTEGGASIISRPIDDIILKIQSSNYTNFKTATWGIGYESDNAYLAFTVTETDDEVATIVYRYSTLTGTWTTYSISNTCGTINQADDTLYLGAADVAYVEKERKTFSRLDYADREIASTIANGKLLNMDITIPSVTGIEVGDVIVQDQTINTTEFNILLEKLDLDSGVTDTDYLSTLEVSAGDNLRTALVSLAAKLDTDVLVNDTTYESSIETKTGTITGVSAATSSIITSAAHGLLTGRKVRIENTTTSTPDITGTYEVTVIDANTFSIPKQVTIAGTDGDFVTVDGDFQDIKTCYNKVINMLNADTGVSFTNYKLNSENTIQEAIITDINTVTRTLTVNLPLDFVVGAIVIYKAIRSSFTYAPSTMNDPLMLKRMSEATIMFESRNITGGELSFATDILPAFQGVPFNLDGNGIFGHNNFGTGLFGGVGNAAPFRTFIPRQCQWCRYIVVKFSHNTAREDYRVNGITLTGNISLSSRAYK